MLFAAKQDKRPAGIPKPKKDQRNASVSKACQSPGITRSPSMGQTDESHREPRGPDKSTSDMTTAEMVVLLSRRVLTPRRIRELLSVVGQVDQLESHVRGK